MIRPSLRGSQCPSRPRGPWRAVRRAGVRRQMGLESLESRVLLHAANALDSASASILTAGSTRELEMTVATPGATTGTPVALMVQVNASSTSSLDPDAVTLRNAAGGIVTATNSNRDFEGNESLAQFDIPAGEYTILVRGEGSTTGGFDLTVSLVGDIDLSQPLGRVSDYESLYATAALSQANGVNNFVTNTFFQSRGIDMSQDLFNEGLDANGNGRTDSFDVGRVNANFRAGTVQVTLQSDVNAPVITAQLTNDTGTSATDRITTDPSISGTVTDDGTLDSFQIRLDNGSFVNFPGTVGANGAFTLTRAQLDTLAGGTLAEGAHTLQFDATDDVGNSVDPPLSLTFVFISQNAAPTATTIPTQTATEDQAFSFNSRTFFTDADPGDVLRFNLVSPPAWLLIDAATGVLTGTPRNGDVGTPTITVRATDSQGATVNASFTLNVVNTNDAPVVGDIPNQSASIGQQFTLNIGSFVSDVDVGDTLSISVERVDGINSDGTFINPRALPSWLTYNPTTRILSGTPAQADFGTIMIGVRAVDLVGADDTDLFSINVGGNLAPVSTPIPNQTATVGAAFNFNASSFFSDPNSDPLTFSAIRVGTPNTLPAWLTFNTTTGVFTGTPTAADVGTLTVEMNASDTGGLSATARQFTITVSQASTDSVRFTFRTFDTNGNPITTINPGGTFELRTFVQDIRPASGNSPRGLFSTFLDVTYDGNLATPQGSITHSTTYGAGTSGSTATAGLIDEVGGTDGVSPLGTAEFEVFRLQFTAGNDSGTITFTGDAAEDTILHPLLLFGTSAPVNPADIEFGTTTIVVGGLIAPLSSSVSSFGVPRNPLDVNGDRFVGPIDALLVMNQMGQSVAGQENLDTNGDGYIGPVDALGIINELISMTQDARPASSIPSAAASMASTMADLTDNSFADWDALPASPSRTASHQSSLGHDASTTSDDADQQALDDAFADESLIYA